MSPFVSKQFRFHSPSEHTIDGRKFPMEMQIVYSLPTTANRTVGYNAERRFQAFDENYYQDAVVSVLFDVGSTSNKCLVQLMRTIPEPGCTTCVGDLNLDCIAEQLTGPYYSYDG